jgi:hypothetical protein
MLAARQEYDALLEWQKPYFDQERYRNPFGDVRILVGPDDVELDTVLLGINIHVPELLLADYLRRSGRRVDAVIAHHTNGIGYPRTLLNDIMLVNIEYLVAQGVPRAAAERCILDDMATRLREHEDAHRIGPDTARLLGLPLACIHTPCDYFIRIGIQRGLDDAQPATVGDLVAALMGIPEFQSAAREARAFPTIMSGDPDWPVGRLLVKSGGGFLLPVEAYTMLGQAGVNTAVHIGCTPAHARAA